MRIFALVIAALLTVTACQTTENIGSGPISDMSESTIESYKHYLQIMEENEDYNSAFAYSKSSRRSGWAGQHQADGVGEAIKVALETCDRGRGAGRCEILDINGRIVWKGMDPRVLASLQEELPEIVDTRTHEYDGMKYRITDRQLKKFRSREKSREQSNFSAFFVSGDGVNYGDGYTKGNSQSNHSFTIRNARRDCQIASPERKCFLFATNGEPVNEDARRALEREN
ncbi:MAG: hypothetical protein V7723_18625 [Sneathiella sp.]|uniref:hypothetical protein n=1 Tax=Sneathiella sp. TaxID=1964365 RepID=UPI0030032815